MYSFARDNGHMTMRAGRNERIGASGETKVKAKFEDLGWGASPNPTEHDLGTDLWVHARDARRFDLGVLVGVQVKSSDDGGGSYFSHPTTKNEVEGYWYSESDQDHFKYWTSHAVPHLLVLHNHETNISYWVHVTQDNVIETGKGAKVLVPASQTLDAEHRDALLKVATSQRLGTTWAGSVWSSQNQVYREDRLRYALIAPRLIAPHPNAMPTTLEPEQAIAMVTQMRLRELDSPYQDRHYPTKDEPGIDDDWLWRFYAVFRQYIDAGDPRTWGALTASATTSEQHAASSVIQAACFIENGRLEEAQAVLVEALERDNATPADHAWLQVQHARCLRDLGDVAEAQRTALEIQNLRQAAQEDPTAMAICGAAADIIFSTSTLGNGDFERTIIGRDTPTAWWRSQVMSAGLADQFAGDFKQWANDESMTYGKADTAWLKLRAVSLMSGFSGDHASWRHSLSLLAQRQLMTCERDGSTEQVVASLRDLRWAGDEKALEKATRRVVLDGPATAAREVAQTINLAQSTRTSIQADIAFLKRAADVLDAETADRTVGWALQTITDSGPFRARYQPTFAVWYYVMKLLAATVPAASPGANRNVIEHVLALPPQDDQYRALLCAQVLEAISPSAWTSHDMGMLANRATGDHEELTEGIDQLLAQHDTATRERLTEEIRSGSLRALDSFPDIRLLSPEAVSPVTQVLQAELGQQQDDARRGVYGQGGRDLGRALTILNMWHPEAAAWEPVIELLAEPTMAAHQLSGTLSVLSWMPDRVPTHIVERVTPLLREWMTRTPRQSPFLRQDVRGQAADALNALRPDALTNEDLWSLMGGTRGQRASAVLVIARRKNPADINLLAAFAQDGDVKVRATVANCLAGWVKDQVNPKEALELLQGLLQDSGTRLAVSVSDTLASSQPEVLQQCGSLVELLKNHISAKVRRDLTAASR